MIPWKAQKWPVTNVKGTADIDKSVGVAASNVAKAVNGMQLKTAGIKKTGKVQLLETHRRNQVAYNLLIC